LPYDRLVIATGATAVRPDISGASLPGVFALRSMGDGLALDRHLRGVSPATAVLVGGGYIGMEMAEAFIHRGLRVTLVEHGPAVLPSLDGDFGLLIGRELEQQGVSLATSTTVSSIEPECAGGLVVHGSGGFRARADLVLFAVGVRPESVLAARAGVATGIRGAIRVDRTMATSLSGVYAAGDCVETWHRLLNRPAYLPLGSTAHKQGHVAGENAAGGEACFAGSLGTQVVRVFGLVAARTGLLEHEARDAGFQPLSVTTEAWDRKRYYPGASKLRIKLTGDRATGRLLGAQVLGQPDAQVAKRIDILASALCQGLTLGQLSDLDLSYTPPFGTPWDAVQVAAQEWEQANLACATSR
jgi:NADPH-dependent 2,4-dienoyl-CoA reductase/sulfur reductase-like enzyme